MKKRNYYIILIGVFVLAAGFVVMRYNNKERSREVAFYPLLERKSVLSKNNEYTQTKRRFDELMKIIGTNPGDNKSRIALASLYIQEARITGEYTYYDMAAMKYVNEVLENEPENFEALTFKALLYLSQHHFAEGLTVAEKARDINPYNAFVYGILVDANVEMGNYKAAVENADKMISIRPDIRSYSRISYLREIHGDYPGAIEAMKMAIEAGPPGDEPTEWARVQLGHLYENTGDWKNAELTYQYSLQYRSGYAYAIAGLARVASASKDYPTAISYYLQADSLINDRLFKEKLAELYSLIGQKNKADELNKKLIAAMGEHSKRNEDQGHHTDHELAEAFLRTGEYNKALKHAMAEYTRRPQNIDANEIVALVYYHKGDYKKAIPFMEIALKTGSNKPNLLCEAGLIYAKAGDRQKAKVLLEKALHGNPNIAESLRSQALDFLKAL